MVVFPSAALHGFLLAAASGVENAVIQNKYHPQRRPSFKTGNKNYSKKRNSESLLQHIRTPSLECDIQAPKELILDRIVNYNHFHSNYYDKSDEDDDDYDSKKNNYNPKRVKSDKGLSDRHPMLMAARKPGSDNVLEKTICVQTLAQQDDILKLDPAGTSFFPRFIQRTTSKRKRKTPSPPQPDPLLYDVCMTWNLAAHPDNPEQWTRVSLVFDVENAPTNNGISDSLSNSPSGITFTVIPSLGTQSFFRAPTNRIQDLALGLAMEHKISGMISLKNILLQWVKNTSEDSAQLLQPWVNNNNNNQNVREKEDETKRPVIGSLPPALFSRTSPTRAIFGNLPPDDTSKSSVTAAENGLEDRTEQEHVPGETPPKPVNDSAPLVAGAIQEQIQQHARKVNTSATSTSTTSSSSKTQQVKPALNDAAQIANDDAKHIEISASTQPVKTDSNDTLPNTTASRLQKATHEATVNDVANNDIEVNAATTSSTTEQVQSASNITLMNVTTPLLQMDAKEAAVKDDCYDMDKTNTTTASFRTQQVGPVSKDTLTNATQSRVQNTTVEVTANDDADSDKSSSHSAESILHDPTELEPLPPDAEPNEERPRNVASAHLALEEASPAAAAKTAAWLEALDSKTGAPLLLLESEVAADVVEETAAVCSAAKSGNGSMSQHERKVTFHEHTYEAANEQESLKVGPQNENKLDESRQHNAPTTDKAAATTTEKSDGALDKGTSTKDVEPNKRDSHTHASDVTDEDDTHDDTLDMDMPTDDVEPNKPEDSHTQTSGVANEDDAIEDTLDMDIPTDDVEPNKPEDSHTQASAMTDEDDTTTLTPNDWEEYEYINPILDMDGAGEDEKMNRFLSMPADATVKVVRRSVLALTVSALSLYNLYLCITR